MKQGEREGENTCVFGHISIRDFHARSLILKSKLSLPVSVVTEAAPLSLSKATEPAPTVGLGHEGEPGQESEHGSRAIGGSAGAPGGGRASVRLGHTPSGQRF